MGVPDLGRRVSHRFGRALAVHWERGENWLTGPLAPEVRYNVRAELASALSYGALGTVLTFLPLVLRRLGGSVEMLALYTASTYLGDILSTFGLLLIPPGQTKRFALSCWFVARVTFMCLGLVTQNAAFLVLAAFFWLFNDLALPAYGTIIQRIYPMADRGKILALVRFGGAGAVLLFTPLAGWLLDHAGHEVVFFLGGLGGVISTLLFGRVRVDEASLQFNRRRALIFGGDILRHDRRYRYYLAGVVVFGFSSLIPGPLYPLVLADRLQLSYQAAGWLGLLFAVSRLGSYFFWGRRIDRWGPARCLQIAFALNVLVILPYIWATSGWMLAPAYLAQGILNSAIDIGFIAAATLLAPPQRVSEYTALQFTLVGARGIAGPLIGVALLRLGLPMNAIFLLSAGLALVSAWVLGLSVSASGAPVASQTPTA